MQKKNYFYTGAITNHLSKTLIFLVAFSVESCTHRVKVFTRMKIIKIKFILDLKSFC